MFNFFKKRTTVTGIEAIAAEAFASGLLAGIGMVRIASRKDFSVSLEDVADVMESVLYDFKKDRGIQD